MACRGGAVTTRDQRAVAGIRRRGGEPALLDNSVRVARREEVMARLTAAISLWQRDELGAACDAAGVPAGPINHVDEVFADPHVLARGMRGEFAHPTLGSFDAVPLPYKFEGWDNPVPGTPPLLGQHTDALLGERLGYTPARIAELRAAKVI